MWEGPNDDAVGVACLSSMPSMSRAARWAVG
jgi:hypothetical protein